MRHTGKLGYVYTKAMLATPGYQLAQEDDLVANLFYRYIKVFNAVERIAQFIQLMVMRGKQCFWLMWALVLVLPRRTRTQPA